MKWQHFTRARNNVETLDLKTDIFDVMAHCDVLVSEESSTLIEAAMVGVVPLAVTDWKIPDYSSTIAQRALRLHQQNT